MDSARQKQHYETIHNAYEAHYYDSTSYRYRKEFMYDWLLKGIDLNGCTVADLACGSGQNSQIIKERFPQARLVGHDISSKACESYRKNTGGEAHELDLTKPAQFQEKYDAAIIFGGLHHCVVDLKTTFENIAGMLKPGGWLLMMEPNKAYVLEGMRRFWYRHDKYFDAETEEALDHQEILDMTEGKFLPHDVRYLGGPAYFLILNSLLFRIPVKAKRYLAPPLFLTEHLYNTLMFSRYGFPVFIARWKRASE